MRSVERSPHQLQEAAFRSDQDRDHRHGREAEQVAVASAFNVLKEFCPKEGEATALARTH